MKAVRKVTLTAALFVMCACGGGSGGGDGNDNGGGIGTGQFGGSCSLKVTNGSTCSPGDGPIALVIGELANGTPRLVCTGTFVTSRHVLTAAHCITSQAPRIEIQVANGLYSVSRSYVPSTYNENGPVIQGDDYAVLELKSAVPNVATLPLLGSEAVSDGVRINVIGFGQDERGEFVFQPLAFGEGLRKGTMIVSHIDTDTGIFGADYKDTGQSVCEGDSGGPAIVISSSGQPAIAGVAQALSEPSGNTIRCLQNSTAYFTPVATGGLISFVKRAAPGAGVI